jgi:hypothetical protein
MYEISTGRCDILTREVCWIDTTISNLPTFYALNNLENLFVEFEDTVPIQQRLLALDKALKSTLERWQGTNKRNIANWIQCRTLMITRFLEQVKGCEFRYTSQSFLKYHVRGCEEAWSCIHQEQWVHKFINNLDIMTINWYVESELHLTTVDWQGMIQNFVATFLFEIQQPLVDQALQVVRQKCL